MADEREVVVEGLDDDDEDEGRVLNEGEGAVRRPEPVSRPGGSGSDWLITLISGVASLALVLAIWSFFFSHNEFSDLRGQVAAKADSMAVAHEIARLDSVVSTKANQDDLTAAVGSFTAVGSALNNRLVVAEKAIGQNHSAVAAARKVAKEARDLAAAARAELAHIEGANQNRWSEAMNGLDGLRKEMDSRVGQVVVDLRVGLAVVAVDQAAVDARQDTTISALREYVGLSDKRLQQAAKRLEEKKRKAAEKLQKEEEKRRKKAEKEKK